MIQGALILFVGILIGYSIRFWKRPSSPKPNKFDQIISKSLGKQAKIVDLVDKLDSINLE